MYIFMFCCKVCLDTVLDLTIKESHGDQEKIRQYSLEELQELMNKLMLMSGKEEQSAQVEKFSEVSFLFAFSSIFQIIVIEIHVRERNEHLAPAFFFVLFLDCIDNVPF